jgi:transposase
MDGSIVVSNDQRKALLKLFRYGPDVRASRRAQIVLLLAEGWSLRQIRAAAFASFEFIVDSADRFRRDAVQGLIDPPAEPNEPPWLDDVVGWLSSKSPEDFGYFRTRWSCETLAEVLAWEKGIRVSAETIRRALHAVGFVWRRPRPVLGRTDPDYDSKLEEIRALLESLDADETAVFEDEVDVNLNPKIGSCWMLCGEQAEVVTPGDNVKRHLAGSLVWRTGTLLVSPAGARRNAELFVAHLDELRRRLRSYRVIHVICDNASFHDCSRVSEYLAVWGQRIQIHYLPKYAPQTNPIERIWWRMHETLTRNHRCQHIDQLLGNIYDWVQTQRCFFTRTLADYTNAA